MATKVTGGASSAVASSSHAACERFRGTDPLVTGVSRRKLAEQVGFSKGPESSIPLLRWVRAMAFERLVRDPRFASEVVTVSVGSLGLARPSAVSIVDAHVDVDRTARALQKAHDTALAKGTATLLHQLAVPFVGLEGQNATVTRPDFAVIAPKAPDKDDQVEGSWLIVGDAKDFQRIRSKIDDGRLLKGFLQVALGAESASVWSKLPEGMSVHRFGILAVPRNSSLSPTAVIEDLTDHRQEVRLRAAERAAETAGYPVDVSTNLAGHLSHLRAKYSPDSCPGCDLFVYCRSELQQSSDPLDLLVELGVRPELRSQAAGLLDPAIPVGKVVHSVRQQIEATLSGVGVLSGQRRLDPVGQPGTVNVVLAKSDGAALGVYGLGVQRVAKSGAEPWQFEVYANPDSDQTRRGIMKTLGKMLSKAMAEQSKTNHENPPPIHLVVPDSTTADILVSIADSVAGKELSRLRWERDKEEGRPALTYNGEPAVLPSPLREPDRVAVSFLLEQDRARTMKSRSTIIDLRATLAALVTAGGPAVNALRLDYLAPWVNPSGPLDYRVLAEQVEKSEHSVGAQLTPPKSNAIHIAFAGDKPGLPRPAKPAVYDELVRSELSYKAGVFDDARRELEKSFALSKLQPAVRAVESDAQRVWRRRLDLHAFDLVRFGRTAKWWRRDLVPILEADDVFRVQVAALTNPQAAHDMAQDAGNRRLAIARVVSVKPLLLEVDSRRIGNESRIVLLHVNDQACVEQDPVTVKIQKGSFKISDLAIGELATDPANPQVLRWAPANDPSLSIGDELVVADFAWFSDNKGSLHLNVPRPSLDSSSAPRGSCDHQTYADDPAHHQWCCKPHEAAEAEWSDELAARRERGELNPQAWPPVIDSDAFDVSGADENLPDPSASPGELPPDGLSMDDLE